MKSFALFAFILIGSTASAKCQHEPGKYRCQELIPSHVGFQPKCWNGYQIDQAQSAPSHAERAQPATIYTWSCTKS